MSRFVGVFCSSVQGYVGGAAFVRTGPGEHVQSEGTKVLLFVRQTRKDARKFTEPYTLLGPARYQSHTGGRPMQIVWELEHPIPPEIYEETKAAAG